MDKMRFETYNLFGFELILYTYNPKKNIKLKISLEITEK